MATADALTPNTTPNPSRNGTETMETLIAAKDAPQVKTDAAAELEALIELSANDLSLVGGGTANVAFL